MDAKRLEQIRNLLDEPVVVLGSGDKVQGAVESDIGAELLDYIDALKADMAKIRGLALQLTALSYSPAAIAGSEIYNLAAQHADEPEV